MPDGPTEVQMIPVKVEFSKWTGNVMPDGYKNFVSENALALSSALKKGDQEAMRILLAQYSESLPKGASFREIASIICAKKNGDIYISAAQGSIDTVDAQAVGDLIDEMSMGVPIDTESMLFIHIHPSPRAMHGPFAYQKPGWSDSDINFLSHYGVRLQIYGLKHASISLLTADDRRIILTEGKNEGRAFGWTFPVGELE